MTGTVTTGWKCSVCGVAATQMYQIAGRWYCWLHRPNIYPSECHNTKPVTVDDCKSIIVGVDDLQRTDREIATLRAQNARLQAQMEADEKLLSDIEADMQTTIGRGWLWDVIHDVHKGKSLRAAARDAALEAYEKESEK